MEEVALGLAIVRKYRLHHGEIKVESEEEKVWIYCAYAQIMKE